MAGENARVVSAAWDEASAADWDSLLARAGRSVLQQSWAYGAAVSRRGRTVHRAIWRATGACSRWRRSSSAASWARDRRGVLRGPVWLDAEAADKAAVLRVCWRAGRAGATASSCCSRTPKRHRSSLPCGCGG